MWKRGCGTFYLDWNVDTDPHKTLTSLSDTWLVLVGFDVLFISISKIHIKRYLDSVPCWMKFKLNLLCDRECNAIFKFNPVSSEKLEEILLDVHCHIFKMTLSELAQVIHKIWRVIYMKVSERNFQRGRKVTALKAWLDNDIYGKQRQKQQQQGWIEEYFQDSNEIFDELNQWMSWHPRSFSKVSCDKAVFSVSVALWCSIMSPASYLLLASFLATVNLALLLLHYRRV